MSLIMREVKMDSLKVLIMNGMNANERPITAFNWNWVTNFENLEELHCRDCKTVVQLPKDIAKIQKLRYLDIAGKKIVVQDIIGELKSLEVLVVDEDMLKFYEQNFRHLLPKLKIKIP